MMAAAPPPVPAAVTSGGGVFLLFPDGTARALASAEAADLLPQARPLLCHAPAVAARIGRAAFPAHDLLELFAFVRPARFCAPSPHGLAVALDLPPPETPQQRALTLVAATRRLLAELRTLPARETSRARAIATAMQRGGWLWAGVVLEALGGDPPHMAAALRALRVWDDLAEVPEHAPQGQPGSRPLDPAAVRARLATLVGRNAEPRPQQADYAGAVAAAFQPREAEGVPRLVLAEAGTGVGKTLGYIAPASLWAEQNDGVVWLSTYTRNLQRQIDAELDRLHPDPDEKALRVVVRKGRENYLCLLNLEDATGRVGTAPQAGIGIGLLARWAAATRDGDMAGGDFPGWLPELLGRPQTLGLTDRRGECVYAACAHYDRCFVERSVRRARRARLVVANHALVLVQAALGGAEEGQLPPRLVFDEGHHLFDAADSAFSAHLSGLETADLRRWLLGAEGGDGKGSRARGLARRMEDLASDDPGLGELLDAMRRAARCLPGPGWAARLAGEPSFAAEQFLALVRAQVLARAGDADGPYSLEAETRPLLEGLAEAAAALEEDLGRLVRPLQALARRLAQRLDEDAETLDEALRRRLDGLAQGIERRALLPLAAWRSMLADLARDTPPEFVDWMAIERIDGRVTDVGLHRHHVDPTVPLMTALSQSAHGVLVTSATLRDGSGDPEADWETAEARTGALHLRQAVLAQGAPAALLPVRAEVPSPFRHDRQTRVLVVTDVRKDDLAQVASAYRELFLAAGGGALGLFTAVSRLRAVHRSLAPALDETGITLFAQHVDGMDPGSLVDAFRVEENACLLGTDAMRDGVDVPGRSLRLIVFDRVPWPRPDILHRARKARFGGRLHDDRITRLRLKQAYGRLVRRADDRGVFVLLDPMMPSRLAGAFPAAVRIERLGLAEAVAGIREFLAGGS